jgi:hypothetical protein
MNRPTKPSSILDEQEYERILQQHMGVFRHQIREYGETVRNVIQKPKTNYAR